MNLKLLLVLLFLVSCSQRIKVPINRFLSPESIGGGAQIEYRDMGFSTGIINFTGGDTDNPLTMNTIKEEEFYFGAGISEKADLFIRVPKESSSLIGIKVQLMGSSAKASAVGHNLAFTLGMGSERDSFNEGFKIELKSDVTDYSLIHGYRINPYVMIYDGISLSNYSFEGTVKGDNTLNSDQISYQARNILGAHIGAVLGGSSFNLKLEWAAQKITWTNTEEKLFQHFGATLSAGW